MKMTRLLATTLILTAFYKTAIAAPFSIYDARSAGMGGTGVASSQISSSSFSNPAMLAAQREKENVSLILGLGGEVSDNDNLLADIEAFNAAFNQTPQDNAGALDAIISAFDKKLHLEANTFLSVGVAFNKWAFAANANGYLQAAVSIERDLILPANPLRADIVFTGIEVMETGVSIARRFGNLAIGVTPKQQFVTTYDSRTDLGNIADVNGIINSITTTGIRDQGSTQNLDMGVVYKLTKNWTLGAVQRNSLSKAYNTGTNTITLAPQTRAGVAYNRNFVTLAVDYDLTVNAPIIAGGEKTQYLSTGVEFDLLESLQLRGGIKQNLANSSIDTYSVGVGLNIFTAQVDVAVVGNSNTFSALVQLGMRW